MSEILVLYYSRHGSVTNMAKVISRGVESIDGCTARVRTLPEVSANTEATENSIPASGPPYAEIADLEECDGIIIGSPAYFGSMAAPMKYFLDQTTPQWLSGALVNKPAAAFTSSSSFHGGQEAALFAILVPLLHHGAIVVGIPYTEESLNITHTGGTPYGATHISGQDGNMPFSVDEKKLCHALGKRVASLACLTTQKA
ncbi:MAG: NAD(P)H:quinone oxidoreductase [Arenicellales bacterium]